MEWVNKKLIRSLKEVQFHTLVTCVDNLHSVAQEAKRSFVGCSIHREAKFFHYSTSFYKTWYLSLYFPIFSYIFEMCSVC